MPSINIRDVNNGGFIEFPAIKGETGPQGEKGDPGLTTLYAFTIENGNLYVENQNEIAEKSFKINENGELEVEF